MSGNFGVTCSTTGCKSWIDPVPPFTTWPITMREEGDLRSSFSPWRQASVMKFMLVSKLIFRSGDALEVIPIRFNGL